MSAPADHPGQPDHPGQSERSPRPDQPTLQVRLPEDPAATEAFGAWLGARLQAGDVLALVGPMGAGKTTLARGLARGLGVDDPDAVASPTYLLVVEHPGLVPLLHADAYLPDKLAGFLADGGLDYLYDRRAASVVEWGDRIRNLLPEHTFWLQIEPSQGRGRRLVLTAPASTLARWGELPKIWQCD